MSASFVAPRLSDVDVIHNELRLTGLSARGASGRALFAYGVRRLRGGLGALS